MTSGTMPLAMPHSSDGANVDDPEGADAVSILSSRMTDIASDDGQERVPDRGRHEDISNQRRSTQTTTSRPNTAVTSVSQRTAFPTSSSRRGHISGISTQRGSGVGNISGSVNINRPLSSARSHVPSLTSHAFFRPMSSQKLQAQRGGSRPTTMAQQGATEDGALGTSNATRLGIQPNHTTQLSPNTDPQNADPQAPPSIGTEMTEHETVERIASSTSPTHEHHPHGSFSESYTPLQKNTAKSKGLTLNVDKGYKSGNVLSPAAKSPRSFRASFLLPARADVAPHSPSRSTQGREKLASVASSPCLTPIDTSKNISKTSASGKNYQYFTGNTVFCWRGRLQNTRQLPINIATGLLVTAPAVLFFIFSAPWLWYNISPAVPIVFGYLFYLCISSFIHASGSDPGILPRNVHPMPTPDEDEDPLRLGPPTNDWTMIKSAHSATAAMEVPTKYCKTCNIWRPARGHHCRICDNCIETQDHHCVWINNCVGRRNYRYFFAFVTMCTIVGAYVLAASLAQILVYRSKESVSFSTAIGHFRVPFAMVIYSILATPYPAALMVYHLFLVGRGETTREYLNSHKFLKKDRHRPFNQGSMARNWLVVLCRPRPPTYLNFKNQHIQGDQRFGERKGKRVPPIAKEEQDQGLGVGDVEMQPTGASFLGPSKLKGKPRL